jgi:hypothetical protein
MKLWLQGRRFDKTVEIHAESQEVINTLTFDNFQGCMKSWEICWDRCIHAQGDYFKEDGNQELQQETFFFWSYSPNFWVAPCIDTLLSHVPCADMMGI